MNMNLRNIPFSPPEQLWFMVHGHIRFMINGSRFMV